MNAVSCDFGKREPGRSGDLCMVMSTGEVRYKTLGTREIPYKNSSPDKTKYFWIFYLQGVKDAVTRDMNLL